MPEETEEQQIAAEKRHKEVCVYLERYILDRNFADAVSIARVGFAGVPKHFIVLLCLPIDNAEAENMEEGPFAFLENLKALGYLRRMDEAFEGAVQCFKDALDGTGSSIADELLRDVNKN